MLDLQAITQEVIRVSQDVGEFIMRELAVFDKAHIEHKAKNNLVSYVDKEAEKMIVERLSRLVPQAGFVAEEGTGERNPDGYNWLVDPVDGTTNFVHSIPLFSISIALLDEQNHVLLGVIYEPNLKECFHAILEGGAYLNGQPIRVSEVEDLGQSLIATGFPYQLIHKMPQYLDLLHEFIKRTHGFRRLGSAALDLAYVACGRFEGFYEHSLKPWDVAAGALLVQEAGGKVSDLKNGTGYIFGGEILATGSIHQQMLDIIEEYFLKDK